MTTTTTRTVTINAPYVIDADALWSRIFGAEPQAAGSHWRGLRFLNGCDWDRHGAAEVTLEDPEDEDKTVTRRVTIETLALSLSELSFPEHLRREILDDEADCVSADAVIQYAVYGEIVFG